jgi:hypothetical protein
MNAHFATHCTRSSQVQTQQLKTRYVLQGFENPYTNLKGIEKHPNGNQKTTPLLIISNGAYYFTVLGEIYYDVA